LRDVEGPAHRLRGLQDPLGDRVTVRAVQHLAVESHLIAFGDAGEHLAAGVVHQRDAGLDQEPRAEVRVPAGARLGRVDDGGDLAGDELVRAHPVQVGVVDDRDVARAQPLHQLLGPLVHARHADDARRRVGLAPRHVREPHGWYLHCS
jgi:hypothetical protein